MGPRTLVTNASGAADHRATTLVVLSAERARGDADGDERDHEHDRDGDEHAREPVAAEGVVHLAGDEHDRRDLAQQSEQQRGVEVAGAGPRAGVSSRAPGRSRRASSSARARENDVSAASAAENRPAATTSAGGGDQQPEVTAAS